MIINSTGDNNFYAFYECLFKAFKVLFKSNKIETNKTGKKVEELKPVSMARFKSNTVIVCG